MSFTDYQNESEEIIMADISVNESPYYNNYKSVITSTPNKSIDDSGYSTTPSSTLSNPSSNLHQIPEVSISLDHSRSDLGIDLKLSSVIHNFTQNCNGNTLGDITNITNSDYHLSPSFVLQEQSPTKKFKLSSDLRLRFRTLNKYSKDVENQILKRKNSTPPINKNYERISLEDREKVDFIYFLSERHHFDLVIEKIFSFLSDSDMISLSMVSKTWATAVKNSPIAQKKKRMYFKLSKENRCGYEGRDRSAFHNKGYLANISNVMRSPSKKDVPQRSPPVSPSKYRFHVFQKEAKKLSSDQRLVKCPRCSRPASWSPAQSTRAECKGFHCKFIFCTNCLCEYSDHFVHKCFTSPILSTSSCSRRPLISNLAKRKHNLRRLLYE